MRETRSTTEQSNWVVNSHHDMVSKMMRRRKEVGLLQVGRALGTLISVNILPSVLLNVDLVTIVMEYNLYFSQEKE